MKPGSMGSDWCGWGRAARIGLCGMLLWIAGCSGEQASLHEHDHHIPAHWPSGVADAAEKIRQRVELVPASGESEARHELEELVSWVPEIAADSPLPEEDWNGIYQLCEQLRPELTAGGPLDEGSLARIRQLCELLDAAGRTIARLEAEAVPPLAMPQ